MITMLDFNGALAMFVIGVILIIVDEILIKGYSAVAYKLCMAAGIILAVVGIIFMVIPLVM